MFLDDVGWPYGRRDMYYQPDTIPTEFRLPFARKGIVRGRSELSDSAPYNSDLFNAVREGGPRNGVLTAIEDFIGEHRGEYRFCSVRLKSGLGILHFRGTNGNPAATRFAPMRMKAAVYSVYGFVQEKRSREGRQP